MSPTVIMYHRIMKYIGFHTFVNNTKMLFTGCLGPLKMWQWLACPPPTQKNSLTSVNRQVVLIIFDIHYYHLKGTGVNWLHILLSSRSNLHFKFPIFGHSGVHHEHQFARMSEIKNVRQTWMTLDTYKCNCVTPLRFKKVNGEIIQICPKT